MLVLDCLNSLVLNLQDVTKLKIKQQALKNLLIQAEKQDIKYFLMCLDPKYKLKQSIGFSNQSIIKLIMQEKYQKTPELFYDISIYHNQ